MHIASPTHARKRKKELKEGMPLSDLHYIATQPPNTHRVDIEVDRRVEAIVSIAQVLTGAVHVLQAEKGWGGASNLVVALRGQRFHPYSLGGGAAR